MNQGGPSAARRLLRGDKLQQRVIEEGFGQRGGRGVGVTGIETLDRHGGLLG